MTTATKPHRLHRATPDGHRNEPAITDAQMDANRLRTIAWRTLEARALDLLSIIDTSPDIKEATFGAAGFYAAYRDLRNALNAVKLRRPL